MRKFIHIMIIVMTFVLSTHDVAVGQEVPPEVKLRRSQLHQFQAQSGTEYFLGIAFPRGYNQDGSVRYPVLYVLDAGGTFLLMAQTYYLMQLGKELPPMILVGIAKRTKSVSEALASRIFDLTPTRVPEQEKASSQRHGQPVRSGGADAFLSVLTEEIIPWVEATVPASSERGLVGHSLGGLFAAHVLLSSPETFTHYLIGSPSLWWDDGVMFERERAYSRENSDLRARVFLSAGTDEYFGGPDEFMMLPKMLRLAETLSSRNYESLELQSHIFEDETHLSVIAATYSRGLRFLFGEK